MYFTTNSKRPRPRRVKWGASLVAVFVENPCVATNFHHAGFVFKCNSANPRASIGIHSPLYQSTNDSSYDENVNNEQSTSDNIHTNKSADFSSFSSQEFDPEGILLDTDTYLNAESLLQSDGSLNLNGNPNRPTQMGRNPLYQTAASQLLSDPTYGEPETPNTSSTSPDQQLTDDQLLLQAMQNIQNNPQRIDPELLHQQVFAEEEAYLKQSEEFRNSLSSLYSNDGGESPMAKARREAMESYNDNLLDKLLEDIDEMERMAPTKEEAMEQAKSPSDKHVLCSKCGCRVTPDVIERFQVMKLAQAGSTQQPENRLEMLCDACYGMQFRSTDEAKTRLGVGRYGDSTAAKGWGDRQMKPRVYYDKANNRRKIPPVVDTSSMFQMPRDSRPIDTVDFNQLNAEERPYGGNDRSTTTASRPRELGSRELTRRMMQRKAELREKSIEYKTTTTGRDEVVSDGSSTEDVVWTRVTDQKSNRTFYWNKATGEMRKTPPK